MSENQSPYPELTPEQLAAFKAKREELILHWKEEIPKLIVELEYNQLLEKIEASRLNTWINRARIAEIMAPPPNPDNIPAPPTSEN